MWWLQLKAYKIWKNIRNEKRKGTKPCKQNIRRKNSSWRYCAEWKNHFFIGIRHNTQFGKNKDGKAIFGVFANRTHDIIEFENCKIQTKISQEIAKYIIDFINENNISVYDEKTNKGTFRHIIIKYGTKTDEVMCVFVVREENFKKQDELVNGLLKKFKNIKTIVKNINTKNTNVILGDKNIVLYGNGYIQDSLRRIFI